MTTELILMFCAGNCFGLGVASVITKTPGSVGQFLTALVLGWAAVVPR